jgi:hypothetical protein
LQKLYTNFAAIWHRTYQQQPAYCHEPIAAFTKANTANDSTTLAHKPSSMALIDLSITPSPTSLTSPLNNKLHWKVQWCWSLFSRGEVRAFHPMTLMTINQLYCCYY